MGCALINSAMIFSLALLSAMAYPSFINAIVICFRAGSSDKRLLASSFVSTACSKDSRMAIIQVIYVVLPAALGRDAFTAEKLWQ